MFQENTWLSSGMLPGIFIAVLCTSFYSMGVNTLELLLFSLYTQNTLNF